MDKNNELTMQKDGVGSNHAKATVGMSGTKKKETRPYILS